MISLPENADEMNGEIANGKNDDDHAEHLGRLASGAQLHLDGRVGIDRQKILVAHGSAMHTTASLRVMQSGAKSARRFK